MTAPTLAALAAVAMIPAAAMSSPLEREAGPPHVEMPLLNRPPSIYTEISGVECIAYLGDDLRTGKGMAPMPECAEVPATYCAIYGPWRCYYPLPADTWALLTGGRYAPIYTTAPTGSGSRQAAAIHSGGGTAIGGSSSSSSRSESSADSDCGCPRDTGGNPDPVDTPAPIPLPASLPLLAVALGAFGLARKSLTRTHPSREPVDIGPRSI